ncbi:TetR/AcrR family transcriptional regulator [Chitinophaga filiformis]|uniref:TetR/AcrR family transcriptional regulator n=1 Tax=Chitinophaga filiformis TaxID=104663 RepID=UPI001F1DB5BF|nr:TetR/AcrR family transcriptional regulator [Chitinophaga filiformis]MCF6407094.1 TetR/AcrR family transcriptional regulator [Chitinophaga filiformis]
MYLRTVNDSKMAGRPKIFDEKEVVDKAVNVFWTKGYETASADELLEAMGIGKGSFYLAFKGGKKELYEKSLRQYAGNFDKQLLHDLSVSKDPIQLIKDFFMALADDPKSKQMKGCYIGNALVQLSDGDADTKLIAAELLASVEGIFTDVIRKAQEEKRLKNKAKPEVLGKYLINLWNGVNVTRRSNPGYEHLREVLEMSLQVLH